MPTIFTRIIQKEIPSWSIGEDDHHVAFLDIDPVVEGHTLVVPKREVDYFFDLKDEELHRLMTFSKKVSRAIDSVMKPIRTGIVVQGLEVPHAHVHLIPLYSPDQSMSLSGSTNVSEDRMKEIANQIGEELVTRHDDIRRIT